MFKVSDNSGVALLFLLLTLNALFYFTLFSTVSFVDFEQVDVSWVRFAVPKQHFLRHGKVVWKTVDLVLPLNEIL